MKNKIKKYREKMGYTQKQLADECYVTRETINRIENGKTEPTVPFAMLIAAVLNASVYEIFAYYEDRYVDNEQVCKQCLENAGYLVLDPVKAKWVGAQNYAYSKAYGHAPIDYIGVGEPEY